MNNIYYVYTLNRPDGKPFYVGKGYGGRMNSHETCAAKGKQSHVCNVIRKIWLAGKKITATKIECNLTEAESFQFEIELIARYGRIIDGGILVNRTIGGDGASGYRHDLVSLANMREAAQRRPPHSEETRNKMRASMLGKIVTPETRSKISASLLGNKHWNYGKKISPQHKAALIGSRYRPITVGGIAYESATKAARSLGISLGTIYYRAQVSRPTEYIFS